MGGSALASLYSYDFCSVIKLFNGLRENGSIKQGKK